MSIPPLHSSGDLPKGEHIATLDEVEARFGLGTDRRQGLMNGLRLGARNLKAAGVTHIWIDGSFVTRKENPNDIDGCWWWHEDVDMAVLDPAFLSGAGEAKLKYGLDFYVGNITEEGSGLPFPQFFQRNRDGDPKGIIRVELGE